MTPTLNLANRLTILRICLVPLFIAALLYYTPEQAWLRPLAAGIYLLACLTDALDGYFARKMGQKTSFGSYIDPIADKLLLLSGYLSLSLLANLPPEMRMPAWVTLIVISRDVMILTGAVIIYFTTGKLEPQPLFTGKITTVAQMAALFASLVGLAWEARFSLYCVAIFFTLLSGVFYIRVGGRLFQES